MNKSFELTGKLFHVGEIVELATNFKKREFVIDIPNGSTYSQKVCFALINLECNKIDEFIVGDTITVSFNIKGREWISPEDKSVKYFNSLDAYRIFKEENDSFIIHSDTTGEGKDLDF